MAVALACLALAACGGEDSEGGLSSDEADRLDNASQMLEQRDAQFEDREVDEASSDEDDATELNEVSDDASVED